VFDVIVATGKSTTAGINVGNLINGDDINGDAIGSNYVNGDDIVVQND
jgi:hypothetical protein